MCMRKVRAIGVHLTPPHEVVGPFEVHTFKEMWRTRGHQQNEITLDVLD